MADLEIMNIKKHIPNLFTLGNLFFGILATIYAVVGVYEYVFLFVVVGIVLDFFDGFLARIFNVQGELGKQLDSLADMVTSGVAPGVVMFTLLNQNSFAVKAYLGEAIDVNVFSNVDNFEFYLSFVGFLITLAACYRLAKFNIDTRQAESFIGLPTPAMSLFVVALPLIDIDLVKELLSNTYVLIAITIVLSYLMNANLPLLSLKFKSFGFKENMMKYLLIITSVILLILLKFLAIPLIIVFYILLSIIDNSTAKKEVKKS